MTHLIKETTGASRSHHTLDHRALGKFSRLIVDLDCQVPDKRYCHQWLRLQQINKCYTLRLAKTR